MERELLGDKETYFENNFVVVNFLKIFAKNRTKIFVRKNIFLEHIYLAVFSLFSSIVYCIKHFENELPINSKHVRLK